ncbi:MAG: hypothetical protein ACI8PT_004953 [Gammaproteobacteria bacterium]
MRSLPLWAVMFLAISLFAIRQVSATTLVYRNFAELVGNAEGVVIGNVQKIQSVRDGLNRIFTFVTLDNLELLKGTYGQSTLTLRLTGGSLGNEVQEVVGSARFQVGERTLVFVHGNGERMVPLVGWTQGVFQIGPDDSIYDYDGNRVYGIDGAHLSKSAARAPSTPIALTPDRVTKRANAMVESERAAMTVDAMREQIIRALQVPAQHGNAARAPLPRLRSASVAALLDEPPRVAGAVAPPLPYPRRSTEPQKFPLSPRPE